MHPRKSPRRAGSPCVTAQRTVRRVQLSGRFRKRRYILTNIDSQPLNPPHLPIHPSHVSCPSGGASASLLPQNSSSVIDVGRTIQLTMIPIIDGILTDSASFDSAWMIRSFAPSIVPAVPEASQVKGC